MVIDTIQVKLTRKISIANHQYGDLKMSDERRKCEVNLGYGREKTKAYFEMYGSTQKFNESNDSYPVTIAIIEDLDGKVHTVEPHQIKFID